MKKNSPLFFFLFGILFYEIIFPILSNIAEVINGFCQLIQGKQAIKMTEYNEKVRAYKKSLEESNESTSVIGFSIPNYEDDDDEEEDDE